MRLPAPAQPAVDRLTEMAEKVVDDWERAEREVMREGHSATMNRLVRAALERVVRECAKVVDGGWEAPAETQRAIHKAILAKWGLS